MDWRQLLNAERSGDKKRNPQSNNLTRSEFEVDFDRIIFSQPFRRLQDKTQVFPLPEMDFVHTRLTHSLEVSSVGRSLGKSVGAQLLGNYDDLAHVNPFDFGAIVGAASLAHDVGNPPFGHAGEDAISDFFISNKKGQEIKDLVSEHEWNDLINFEGNAQGFRLLTRNKLQGLKLTNATLGAFTKYPRPSLLQGADPNRKSQKKYGFFQSEQAEFAKVADALGLVELSDKEPVWTRHPLTFLVEAADDICYHIIDLEDGFGLGLVTFEETRSFLAEILQERYLPEKLKEIPSDKEKIGVLRAVAIQVLVEQVTQAFLEHHDALLAGEFDQALTKNITASSCLKDIAGASVERIYRSRQVLEREAAGYEVINGLLETFLEAALVRHQAEKRFSGKLESVYRLLPESTKYTLEHQCASVYQTTMTVTDFISGLTDSTAIAIYRTIKGISFHGSRSGY